MNKVPVVLLINDIHVSKDNIPEFQLNWNEALDICQKQHISDIVIGGDLWQSRSSQTLDTLMAVRDALKKVKALDIVVTIAEGNHCKVDQESFLGYSHIFSEYPNVFVVDDYDAYEIGENAILYTMSYFPENSMKFQDILTDLLENDFDKSKYNILYLHEGINGALATSSDKELSPTLFKDFDAVLVGHYHNRCKIKGTNIEYIGASRQHNFGEDEEKGYTIVYEDGSTQFIKNQVNKRYKVIDVTAKDLNENLKDRLMEIKEDGRYHVKVRVNCNSKEASTVDKQSLLDVGATKVEIVTEDTEVSQIESKALDSKFDKAGIKAEYVDFCADRGIDGELGFKYLDKIS